MKIAVLYGGVSNEREVSLLSGKGIIEALEKNNHEVIPIDFNPNKIHEIIKLNVDLVFIGLHGKYGEDGRIQGFLDMLNMPYTGSGVTASALAMDKYKSKQLFARHEIPIARSEIYTIRDPNNISHITENIERTFSLPFVIKPNREGSTLGLTIIRETHEIKPAILKALNNDCVILVEAFVKGTELTVAVMGKPGEEEALPIIEIIPKNELYDYESKYTSGGSEHIVPARINESLTKEIQEYAIRAHQLLGCKTYSRADFILSENGIPIILEVNTLPGMTPTSLVPDAANAVGMTYQATVEKLVQLSKQ